MVLLPACTMPHFGWVLANSVLEGASLQENVRAGHFISKLGSELLDLHWFPLVSMYLGWEAGGENSTCQLLEKSSKDP